MSAVTISNCRLLIDLLIPDPSAIPYRERERAERTADLECAGRAKRRRRFGVRMKAASSRRTPKTTALLYITRFAGSIVCWWLDTWGLRPRCPELIGGLVPGAHAPGFMLASAPRTWWPQALCWRPLRRTTNPLAPLPAVNWSANISRPLCGLIDPLIDQENASAIFSIRVRAAGFSSPTVARKFGCVIPDPR